MIEFLDDFEHALEVQDNPVKNAGVGSMDVDTAGQLIDAMLDGTPPPEDLLLKKSVARWRQLHF
jgi:hypothetical protein